MGLAERNASAELIRIQVLQHYGHFMNKASKLLTPSSMLFAKEKSEGIVKTSLI